MQSLKMLKRKSAVGDLAKDPLTHESLTRLVTGAPFLIVFTVFAFVAQPCKTHGQVVPRTGEQHKPLVNDVAEAKRVFHPANAVIRPTSIMLVDVDLEKIEMTEMVRWFSEQGILSSAEADDLKPLLEGLFKPLRNLNISHVYIVASASSIVDGAPVILIPSKNPMAVEDCLSAIVKHAEQELYQAGKEPAFVIRGQEDGVLIGPKKELDRIERELGRRPTMLVGLLLYQPHEDKFDHRLVFQLTADAKAELLALWPAQTPSWSPVDFSPKQLVEDLTHVTIDWDMPPEPRVTIRIVTSTESAATRTKRLIEQWIAQHECLIGRVEVDSLYRIVTVTATAASIEAAIGPAKRAAAERREIDALKQLGAAIHDYHDFHGHLPPRCFVDPDGKELLSLRVAILPFLEQNAFYLQFNLAEAWDSEANFEWSKIAIGTYRIDHGENDNDAAMKTTIRFPVYPGSLWDGDGPPRTFRDVTDGTVNTIAAIISPSDAATPWSSPEPWLISSEDPAADVFAGRDRVVMLFLDGSVRTYTKDQLDNNKLKKMLTIAGGEVILE